MAITYRLIYTDDFKFNSYTLNFLMPLTEKNATCCTLLAQVLKRGCEKYGEMDRITSVLDDLYDATISISADKIGGCISFSLHASFMDDRFALEGEKIFERVLDLAGELLLHPMVVDGKFREDFFEQEKRNHCDQIEGLINDKRIYSMVRCKELMFENDDYRFTSLGTRACLESLSAESLYDFYKKMLQSAAVMITYIGRNAPIQELSKKFFPLCERGEKIDFSVNQELPKNMRCISESFDIAQGKLCMGFRFRERPDYYAARLFNVIYGGSPTSKLFNNVRERLSLCYYCSSMIDHLVPAMFISSGIEFFNYEIARNEIFKQLKDMQNGIISDEEFINGKLYLKDQILGIRDSHGALLSETLRSHLLGINHGIEQQVEFIEKLTKDDVVSVANLILPDTVYFMKGEE